MYTAMEKLNRCRTGQSLVELLIGMGLAVVVMITAMALLQFLLGMSAQDPVAQTGTLLTHEVMRAVTAVAEGSWPTIASASGLGNYHVATSMSGFVLVSGFATTTINAVPYTIAITVAPVQRTVTNEIDRTGTGTDDPSTKKVTAIISWTHGGHLYSNRLESYVARTRNEVVWQTDWVGGPTCPTSDAPVLAGAVTTQLCTASSTVDYTTMPGSIRIKGL